MGYTDLRYLEDASGGNNTFVKEMVGLFLEQTPDLLDDMDQALSQEQWKELSGFAHKLKSSLKMMGVYALEEDLKTIELAAKQGEETNVVTPLMENVRRVTTAVVEELKAR